MRLTIIPADSLVSKDNYSFSGLDLSACGVPADVHALQWYDTEGEVEFVEINRQKPQNEVISELPVWATACVEVWNVAKAAEEARIAAELAAQEAAAAAAAAAAEPIPVTQV